MKGLGDKRLLWIDLDRDEPDADQRSVEMDDLLGLGVTELRRDDPDAGRARLTRTEDRIHLTLEAIEGKGSDDGPLVRREIDFIAGENVVISIHSGDSRTLERYRDGLEGETQLGILTAGDLLSSFVEEVLDGYFLVVERIEREIDDLDQRALYGRHGDDILGRIVELRHKIGLVRRTLAPHRGALSTLALPEMRAAQSVGQPWPGLVDRLEAAMDAIEGLRDSLLGTFDIHMGRVSQRANDVMRALTLLSAVLLPAVVLAGVMGMNFKLDFFDTTSNFWVVIGAMGVLAVSILAVARWRDWL